MAAKKAKTTEPNETPMTNPALAAYATTTFDAKQARTELDGKLALLRPSKLTGPLTFRVIPAKLDWDDGVPGASAVTRTGPFVYHWRHIFADPSGSGFITFDCPERNGAGVACPVCAEAKVLRNSKDKGDQDLGWDMSASREGLVNILIRNGERAGQVATMTLSAPSGRPQGKTQLEKLLAAAEHPVNGGDIVHPLEGYDVVLTKTGSDYAFSLVRQPSRLADSDDAILELINDQPALLEILGADVEAGKLKARELAGGTAQPAVQQRRPAMLPRAGGGTAEDDVYAGADETDDIDY